MPPAAMLSRVLLGHFDWSGSIPGNVLETRYMQLIEDLRQGKCLADVSVNAQSTRWPQGASVQLEP